MRKTAKKEEASAFFLFVFMAGCKKEQYHLREQKNRTTLKRGKAQTLSIF
jgi:hypothetical protein